MPKMMRYTSEFRAQAVRLVFESMDPSETRKEAGLRLAPRVNVKEVTLYNRVKLATAIDASAKPPAGSGEELRAQVAQLKREHKELARANEILISAASFFGAELDRHSKR